MGLTIERNVRREQIWARVFLSGPSGSGKTRGALELASRLMGGGLPIALANTEPNRGKLYADRFPLEALIDIEGDYHPERFIEAIDAAEQIIPGGVFILDSATHEWYGTNGITQLASRFGDWAKARPLHQKFVDRLQVMQCHVIVCCRAKMKYEQVEVDGKQTVVTLGVGPMQDADFQYEFSLAGQIDRANHQVEWSGHVDALEGKSTDLVEGADETAIVLSSWLSEGDPLVILERATDDAVAELRASLDAEGIKAERIAKGFADAANLTKGILTAEYVATTLAGSRERLQKKIDDAGSPAAAAEQIAEESAAA